MLLTVPSPYLIPYPIVFQRYATFLALISLGLLAKFIEDATYYALIV